MSKQTGCDCHDEFKALRDQLAAAEARAAQAEKDVAAERRLRALDAANHLDELAALRASPGSAPDDERDEAREAALFIMVELMPLIADSAIVGRTYGWPQVLGVVMRVKSELLKLREPAPRQPDVTAALLAALKEAEQAIHSEYCTAICHPACCAVTAAIKLAEATPDTPGGRG